jgi:hypothetical protein
MWSFLEGDMNGESVESPRPSSHSLCAFKSDVLYNDNNTNDV